jgi:hypothetical protein
MAMFEACKICGKSLDGVSKVYRGYRVCGERCYQIWMKRLKAEIKREMRGLDLRKGITGKVVC